MTAKETGVKPWMKASSPFKVDYRVTHGNKFLWTILIPSERDWRIKTQGVCEAKEDNPKKRQM